jgi:hypothetical protein
MRLTLAQEQAVTELANHLYDFLPGQADPFANQSISFQGAAQAAHVGSYWQGGSKRPAIVALLRATWENKPEAFCDLINEIVRKALAYRSSKNPPIMREDIQTLNELLEKIGFKIPELRSPKFLDSLPAANHNATVTTLSDEANKALLAELHQLASLEPRPRGYVFAKFLQQYFWLSKLAPRDAFRLRGEEIDGSFLLQAETYLLEATWRNQRVGEEELNAFAGKVHGKASWSRGLHISYAGYTADGLDGFSRGKRTSIICMDGLCLHDTLASNLDLARVIERKVRRAAETNEAFVPVRNLFPEVK